MISLYPQGIELLSSSSLHIIQTKTSLYQKNIFGQLTFRKRNGNKKIYNVNDNQAKVNVIRRKSCSLKQNAIMNFDTLIATLSADFHLFKVVVNIHIFDTTIFCY